MKPTTPTSWLTTPTVRTVTATILAPGLLASGLLAAPPALGQPAALEEIVVTARQREETLQDAPLTVTAIGADALSRGGVSTLEDLGRLVPNMQIYTAGSGNGSGLYLRGVGSSTISAAFDPAVALNVDGVALSASRMIVAGQLDVRQIEVLKGPQSLYFGKSATAGVVSVLTNDPGDELEATFQVGRSPEHDGVNFLGVLSGPLNDTLGARLALSSYEDEELRRNIDPRASNPFRGRESLDVRLTLTWAASDTLNAKLKAYQSNYEDGGPSWGANITCPRGTMMETSVLSNPDADTPAARRGMVDPSAYSNCQVDETLAIPDVEARFMPSPTYHTYGDWNGGVPYTDQDSTMLSLQFDWNLSDTLDLTLISGYLDLENNFMEVFDYAHGNGASHALNAYTLFSQEVRLQSAFEGVFNFSAGAYYAEVDQKFITGQNAVNIGRVAPDPVTGNRYDWDKEHYTDTETWSVFAAAYLDFTEDFTVTVGTRYSKDQKKGRIEFPYVHAFLTETFPLGGQTLEEGLEFNDGEWTPEISASWAVSDTVNLYAAYKTGYKSGGFDNSALPSKSLSTGDVSALLYKSETGAGYEGGIKSTLLDGRLRFNATLFSYEYEDLQVQEFDATIIQFLTSNAGEVQTQGLEVEALLATNIEGLVLNASLARTDAEFSDTFEDAGGNDLDGRKVARSPDLAGNVGFTYETGLGRGGMMLGLSGNARYSDDYELSNIVGGPGWDSFWQYDASVRLYSADERYEVALIGRNLNDEVEGLSAQSRPFACDMTDGEDYPPCKERSNGELDQIITSSVGRQYTLQFTYRY